MLLDYAKFAKNAYGKVLKLLNQVILLGILAMQFKVMLKKMDTVL